MFTKVPRFELVVLFVKLTLLWSRGLTSEPIRYSITLCNKTWAGI